MKQGIFHLTDSAKEAFNFVIKALNFVVMPLKLKNYV